MKKGDLIVDGDGRTGFITCMVLVYPTSMGPKNLGEVGFAFFFDTQKEEIIYEDDVEVIGEHNGTHILE